MNYGDSLKKEIYKLARYNGGWINGGRYEELARELGYKSSNASRRCRELFTDGYLERRLNDKRCVEYRWQPPKEKTQEETKAEMNHHLIQALM